ncbi:MAG: phosphoribosyl-ATP diphosphatase [Nitrospirae bacterium]|nr:phosphoribosyl-ATP diphosphatase [Nitrospirota bacterium]MBF0533845.1 phosphoribosyl-ATP diphosphatase [Nitrospirota bacterium]MBF0615446.1 phosphoribosyl-ATP diphosphatase [Nitrospirota bacterium]
MEKRVLDALYEVILSRKAVPVSGSYTCKLLEAGRVGILKKLGEEAVETILAAYENDKNRVIYELADLFYHILVFMANEDITPEDVYCELSRRERNPE